MNRKWLCGLVCVGLVPQVSAEWSGNAALVSDYLFNGITQTQKDPALQLGIDWNNDAGVYAGAWGSNVDFGDDTDTEIDVYAGYAFSVNENIEMDIGVAYYTYHGGELSDEGNYPEYYVKTSINNWAFNVWYSNDYFGTGAGHLITMLNYGYPINDNMSLTFGIDRSVSLDEDQFEWDTNDDDYLHWQIVFDWELDQFAVSVGLHDTDLDNDDSSMLVLGISTSF